MQEDGQQGLIRAIFFDVSGTLIEPREDVGTTYSRFAARHGLHRSSQELNRLFRKALLNHPEVSFPELSTEERIQAELKRWRLILEQSFDFPEKTTPIRDFDGFFDQIFAFYASRVAWRTIPESLAGLQAARRAGLLTGIISNFDHRLRPLLEEMKISELIDIVVHPYSCGFSKPDPPIFHSALRALGVDARESVFVGNDPVRDLIPARSLGMHVLDVNQQDLSLPTETKRLANLKN